MLSEREQIARLIDPSSWRVFDHELERVKRHHPNGGYDPDNFTDRASLALADKILALIQAGRDERKEGWVMVPVEPTREMLHAAATDNSPRTATNSMDRMYETVALLYRAMLSAAPASEGDG